MNKAFVREPDDNGQLHCPACGSLGTAVVKETWQAHVKLDESSGLSESAFFCPYARCPVVYFDMFERKITVDALLHSVYPKDPQAPVCGCFGLTAAEIEADARAGVVTRVRQILEKARTSEAHCRELSASGQPCTGDVQRYYMKVRGAS